MRTSKLHKRSLRIESLENREMMTAVSGIDVTTILNALHASVNSDGNIVIPIQAQVGDTALQKVLGVAETLDSVQEAINAYLNSVPGWHLTGEVDMSPDYSGVIKGSVVISTAGVLQSANLSVTASADIAGAVEGYYGISVLHIGAGVAADVSTNLSATASYSVTTNKWYFSGGASIDGYAKGYASAVAWPLKGEVYIKGELEADASLQSDTGLASASFVVSASVGANAQMKNLFGGWKTIASTSKTLGSYRWSTTYDVGSWITSDVAQVVTTFQNAVSTLAAAFAQTTHAATVLTASSNATANVAAETKASVAAIASTTVASASTVSATASTLSNGLTSSSASKTATSSASGIYLAALEQLSATELLDIGLAV
jgi:hypothetical protein